MRTKEELKKAACEAIDRNSDKIFAFADSIFDEPELGFREVKTSEKFSRLLDELGFAHQDHVALTGVVSNQKGKDYTTHFFIRIFSGKHWIYCIL